MLCHKALAALANALSNCSTPNTSKRLCTLANEVFQYLANESVELQHGVLYPRKQTPRSYSTLTLDHDSSKSVESERGLNRVFHGESKKILPGGQVS